LIPPYAQFSSMHSHSLTEEVVSEFGIRTGYAKLTGNIILS
jgi:hypothetical protein